MQSTLKLTTVALLSLLAAACGKEATPAPESPSTAAAPAESAAAPAEKKDDDGSKSDINISDEIKRACGLTDTEAHFAYNSADVREADRTTLKKLADCFATGPLKGRTMNIVGHADPRGEPEYNMVLGDRRAASVAKALVGAGLPEAQAQTTSRGELDATGSDEASWARDRRADLVLAEQE
jgi:peptidoglycan-associated lipoprotein